MNKKMIALGVAVAMAAAVGCGAVDSSAVTTVEAAQEAGFLVEDCSYLGQYIYTYVIVDEETGVEYLWAEGTYRGGLTVMVNPDGTPKIAEGYETEVVE